MTIPGALSGDDLEVRLILPALTPYARVARLAVTGLATRNGFTYDEVEDLRIAVGEVFGMLVGEGDDDGRLQFTCRLTDDAFHLAASRVPPQPLADVGDLSRVILDAITDASTIDVDGGQILISKRSEHPG